MNELEENEIHTLEMNHLGLVSAICKKLKIAERIDTFLPNNDPRIIVSTGMAVVAMIINGLGFVNRRLYMVSEFFQNKPIDRLIKSGIQSENLTDDILGKALDSISQYGTTKLFSQLAFDILQEHNLFGKSSRLDSTSISVSGAYDNSDTDLNITYGFSKDGHSDMKQFMINLATTGSADMPFWYEIKNGNSSDKETFRDSSISIFKKLQEEIKDSLCQIFVSDSALYTLDNIQTMKNMKWLTRVPENISESKKLLESSDTFEWTKINDNYYYKLATSEYGGIKQRWIVIRSEAAYKKEMETFEKKLIDEVQKVEKDVWHLENGSFTTHKEAEKAVSKLDKKYKYYDIKIEKFLEIEKYGKRGRHSTEEKPISIEYKVKIQYTPNKESIRKTKNCKGKFILATNILDENELSCVDMLGEYKKMQGTERGFRFLKDPRFMASEVYLKKQSRIDALMMIMTLCLMVYNFSQYHVRKYLKDNNETLPNQKKKEVQNPTTRWIYEMMCYAVISVIRIPNSKGGYREVVTNIKQVHKKIITIFGKEAMEIYGFG
jgi:transposase